MSEHSTTPSARLHSQNLNPQNLNPQKFDPQNLQTLGVYTSGGDAPGMNAAVRAVVRTGFHHKFKVIGIKRGYSGMMDGDFEELHLNSMANILQRGGTVLKTGRSMPFMKPEGRATAARKLRDAGIDGLVCIGGDGSFRGAHALWEEHQIPCVGVPGTIDNDIYGTDHTIGFDTAVNTALEAIDKIRDTAASHDRLFIVEVMGRDSGYIALDVGLAGGAEDIFVPENAVSLDQTIEHIRHGLARGKLSSILVTAEGHVPGRAYDIAEQIRKKAGFESKVCILGHIQRGGSPTAFDRILASRLGAAAVDFLMKGQCDIMAGVQLHEICATPLIETFTKRKAIRRDLLELVHILSK